MTTRKSKYWRDRVKKEMDAKEADDISLEQSMKQLHDYHFRNIEKEIESFYQRYADKEKIDLSEARKRASELDISAYQKKAKELVAKAEKLREEGRTVTKSDFTHRENADMSIYNLVMKTNALELLRLNIDLEMQELANGEHKLTKRFLDEGYRKETEFQAGLLGLSVASQASVKSLADAVINANFKGAKWSVNIWDRQDKLRSIISQSVQSAILRGKNGLTIARDIRREFDVSASYAKRLAITEHARVQMEVGRLSMVENGFTMFDIIPEPRACDICKDIAKHGPYHLDKWRTGESSPPFHPYCRCAVVGVDEGPRNELYSTAIQDLAGMPKLPPGIKYNQTTKQFERSTGEKTTQQVFEVLRDAKKRNGGKLPKTASDFYEWLKNNLSIFDDQIEKTVDFTYTNSVVTKRAKELGIEYNEIRKVKRKKSEKRIISSVGGGDLTKGSCSSLAMAYVGNKQGYDVLDYRGGNSRLLFAYDSTIKQLSNFDGVNLKSALESNELAAVGDLLSKVDKKKEYYLAVADHAAIVKKVDNKWHYLELQTRNNNGWHRLTSESLKERFGASTRRRKLREIILYDIDELGRSDQFKTALGYINTKESEQIKGDGGHAK